MAKQVESVKVLNIDDVPHAVSDLSSEVQEMVSIFDGWNQREADIVDDLQVIRAAKNNLSMTIIAQIRKEKEAAEGVAVEGNGADADAEVEVSVE